MLWSLGDLSAQSYQAELHHYGVENGLSHREVEAIFQDKDGFIWLGTRFGLNRFDGYAFKSWTKATHGYNFNDISRIFQDDAGWLWLYNGDREVIFLHPHTGEIRNVAERFGQPLPFQTSPEVWPDDPRIPTVDSMGRLYFVTRHPEAAFTYHSQEGFRSAPLPYPFPILRDKASLLNYPPYALYNAAQQSVWKLRDDGWYVFDADHQLQTRLLRSDYPADLFTPNCLYADRQGHVWVGGDFGLTLIDLEANHFKRYFSFATADRKPFNNSARGIWADDYAVVANFEMGGLVKMARQAGSTDPVWQLLDRTMDTPDEVNARGLYGYWGRPLLRDPDGSFWVGADRSLRHLDAAGQLLEKFGFEQPLPAREGAPDIWSLYRDAGGRLWIGYAKGLAFKDPTNRYLRPFNGLPGSDEFPRVVVQDITADRDGNLCLCTNRGLYLIAPGATTAERYSNRDAGNHWLPADNFQQLHQDTAGIYWIATLGNGLLRWNRQTGQTRSITQADGLSSNNLYAVYEDRHGRLWLSSDFGIMQLDKSTFQVRTYLPKDGVAQEEFNRIAHFQSPDGTIFLGGLNGITAFQPDDFYPDGNVSNAIPLCITSFQQFDPRQHQLVDLTAQLWQEQVIRVQPDDRFFQLDFALLAYENVDKIRYAWKLEGLDADWNYQSERTVRLSRLPFGTHTLRIKAQLANGQWSSNELVLPVLVLRPFYLTTWFLVLAGGLLVAGGYGFYHWRIRQLFQRQLLLRQAVDEATAQIQQDKALIETQATELRQLDALKSRFFANVSHELRTPLTLIVSPAEHLLRHQETMTAAQRAQSLRHLLQNGQKLLQLVEELLELSRLDARQVELQKRPVEFYGYCRRIFSAFELKAQQKQLGYTLDYQLETPAILRIDPERLEKILNNLIINALQYTPAGGQVTLTVHRVVENLLIEVQDTGPGIYPQDLPYIFDRYFQSKQRDLRNTGAVGIGLALARELSLLMAGQLSVQSTWGQGSTFTLSLPEEPVADLLMQPSSPETDEFHADPVVLPAAQTMTDGAVILLVEDNIDLQEHLQIILAPAFQVVAASDGAQAWRLLEKEDPSIAGVQLILSDVMMPEMDGFELLERIKGHVRWRELPVVLLTARSDEADRLQGLRLGVDDYLTKPFSTTELLARLHNLLARYQQRQLPPGAAVSTPTEISADNRWLEQLQHLAQVALQNPNLLSVTLLAERMLMSPRNFQRKIKQLTGLTANQYILECRLDRARQLLENRVYGTVREVAFAVGFDTPHYFSTVYQQRFGRMPVSYWAT